MIVLLASLAAAVTVFVGVFTLTTPARPRGLSARLDMLDRDQGLDRDRLLALPFTSRVARPVAARVQSIARRLLPGALLSAVERWLLVAGEPVSLFGFVVVQAFAVFAGVAVALLSASGDRPIEARLLMVVGGVVVAAMPAYWLRIRVAMRKSAIEKALPDALDLLVTTVEAGMSIDAAIAEVGHETHGPLGEELRIAIRETTLGRSRRDALLRLSERVRVADLKTFIQAVIQAEQNGLPIGPVLRTQAAQMRLRKRQRAEAAAQRAPVKMVMVLVLLVLPVMIMFVMGPALLQMNDGSLF